MLGLPGANSAPLSLLPAPNASKPDAATASPEGCNPAAALLLFTRIAGRSLVLVMRSAAALPLPTRVLGIVNPKVQRVLLDNAQRQLSACVLLPAPGAKQAPPQQVLRVSSGESRGGV